MYRDAPGAIFSEKMTDLEDVEERHLPGVDIHPWFKSGLSGDGQISKR